jgi:hypothetical protein
MPASAPSRTRARPDRDAVGCRRRLRSVQQPEEAWVAAQNPDQPEGRVTAELLAAVEAAAVVERLALLAGASPQEPEKVSER